ncbi:hypothetical protein IMSHALPRED_001903 [Imshaugia aleurites]|uniref:NADP-dependent oxidoreductase domain-containing protein n=1 Tax=Imshaugia aleurites TaxID=172621 RepID=A0A8H3EVS8_9LECA|nr:hypothetical protein IMSHALPRED_001903 [Imshaugia aleurites]
MPSALLDNLLLHGKQAVPAFLYGTAWKKEKTADLVYQAICSGFKGIDTAAQPKHYREDLVGQGVRRALSENRISRDDLYIQTKFTSINGQDPNKMPYDPTASISEQVHTSIKSSLMNMRPAAQESSSESTYLDCLVLHSPLPTMAQTLEAWRAAESYVPHKIRYLGVSNVTQGILEQLYDAAEIKPAIVQNRFYPSTHFDVSVRAFCVEKSIVYQCFWTLSANPKIIFGPEVGLVANQVGLTPYEAMYSLVLALDNVVVLNGTTNAKHMVDDLSSVQRTREWALKYPEGWAKCLDDFKMLLEGISKSKES